MDIMSMLGGGGGGGKTTASTATSEQGGDTFGGGATEWLPVALVTGLLVLLAVVALRGGGK